MPKYEDLNLLTMSKEKRDAKIKGRECADGQEKRLYIAKENMASPTVQLEILTLSLLIYTYEGSDVTVADVVGAYLLADMEDYVLVKLSGEAIHIMCDVNNRYTKYITMEK